MRHDFVGELRIIFSTSPSDTGLNELNLGGVDEGTKADVDLLGLNFSRIVLILSSKN